MKITRFIKLKLSLALLLMLCFAKSSIAQTTLSTGDVAFTAYNSENTGADTFAIMLLTPIAAGTQIIFTDGQYTDATGYVQLNGSTSDWIFMWQTASAIPAYTQIKFWTSTTNCGSSCIAGTSHGSIIGGRGLAIPTSGDQIFACQGISSLDTTTNYRFVPTTFLAGIHTNYISGTTTDGNWDNGAGTSTSNSELPNTLTNGTNCLRLDYIGVGNTDETDNARYNCSVTSGTVATVRTAINNASNWDKDDAAIFSPATCSAISSTTWNGTTWSNGTPTSTIDAIIASSTTPGNFTCKELTINSGVSLTMGSGTTANINGNLTNNGSGFSGVGTFNFAASSTISGNAISCAGTVTVASGATLTTGGLLTLTSDATNTGRIGNSSGTISGNITVQRYIPGGRRAYRFLSHPFTSAQALTSLTDDIDITGTGGSTNGFTTTGSNNPSSYWYDVTTANGSSTNDIGWTAFTNTNGSGANSWDQYEGIRVLVRGAIGEGLTSAAYTPSAVTLDMTGTVNQGTQTISRTKGSGTTYALVGNPFPSPVNMDALSFTGGIGTNFYVWNAQQGTKGGYTTYTYGSSSFSLPVAGAFVTQLSATGSIIIEEADKTASTSTMFKTTGFANRITLNIEDSTTYWDRFQLHYDDNAMAVAETDDALKFPNPEVTFSAFSKDDSALAIDNRPYTENEVIVLGFNTPYQKNYKIVVPDFDMPAGTKLYLKDNYTGKNEELNAGYEYWFTVDANTASQGKGRFELNAIGKPTAGIAAVNNGGLKVKLVPNPTTDNVTLYYEGAGKELEITVTNLMGVKVANATANNANGNILLPTAHLASGMYMVVVRNGSEVMTQKLIKQ